MPNGRTALASVACVCDFFFLVFLISFSTSAQNFKYLKMLDKLNVSSNFKELISMSGFFVQQQKSFEEHLMNFPIE